LNRTVSKLELAWPQFANIGWALDALNSVRRLRKLLMLSLALALLLMFGMWLVQRPAPTLGFLDNTRQYDQLQLPAKYGGVRFTVYEFEGDFEKKMKSVMAELNTYPNLQGSLFPNKWGVGYHGEDLEVQVVRGVFDPLKQQLEHTLQRDDLDNKTKRDLAEAMSWRENGRKFSILIVERKPDAIRKLVGDINKATGDRL
jgi:hypothetical protein